MSFLYNLISVHIKKELKSGVKLWKYSLYYSIIGMILRRTTPKGTINRSTVKYSTIFVIVP